MNVMDIAFRAVDSIDQCGVCNEFQGRRNPEFNVMYWGLKHGLGMEVDHLFMGVVQFRPSVYAIMSLTRIE